MNQARQKAIVATSVLAILFILSLVACGSVFLLVLNGH